MAAATCPLQQSYGLGPRGPDLQPGAAPGHQQPAPGPSGAPGPQQAAPGPSGAARPQQQQQQQQQQQPQQQKHSKPFFYVQPQQPPYVPLQSLQWPLPVHMPMSYNPYFGYPGLGYGMPMMPHYQPNPYVEPPSFIVPHTHLHLMDYRRMLNPQYYHTMAYHSRRFHYNHNSQPRETTTSQVQTEPLVSPQRTGTPSSSQVKSPDVLDARGAPSSELPFTSSATQKVDSPAEVRGSAAPVSSTTPSTGSFTIQTEEVRIECCTTPAGLQLLHAHETAEVSRDFSEDVVTCSSVIQRHVLQEQASSLPVDQAQQALPVCPDILMGGTLSEKIPAALEELRKQTDSTTESSGCESQQATCDEVEELTGEKDQSGTSNDLNLKVIHLPFNAKYLDELRKMESSVWSNEETLIPSPESQLQNISRDSHDETLIPAAEAEILMFSDDVVAEEVPDTPPLEGEDDDENQVSSLETLADEMMADHPSMSLSEDANVAEESETAESALGRNSSLTANRSQHRRDSKIQDHQDTSFESLPAYLPSASWFSDFDNVYICSKVPQAPEKRYRPESGSGLELPARRRKLEMDHKDTPDARRLKDRFKAKADHWSLSDHEYCLSRSFNQDNTYVSKRDQLCSRCVEKHGICASPGAGLDRQSLKRKAVPFQQRNDGVSQTYKVCKSRSNRQLAKRGSSVDVCGSRRAFDTEGESSENSWRRSGPKWLDSNEPVKRPLLSRQNLERHPSPMNQKLREKNYLHNEVPRQHAAWERLRHCPHGNAIREIDENSTAPAPLQDQWRNHVYVKQRWQTESSWKAVMESEDIDGSNSDARSQLLIHRKSQPLSQGTRTKDTRC